MDPPFGESISLVGLLLRPRGGVRRRGSGFGSPVDKLNSEMSVGLWQEVVDVGMTASRGSSLVDGSSAGCGRGRSPFSCNGGR